MSIMSEVGPLDMGELRYLRKVVRKEVGDLGVPNMRKTQPTYAEYGITPERAREIRRLAKSFVRKED